MLKKSVCTALLLCSALVFAQNASQVPDAPDVDLNDSLKQAAKTMEDVTYIKQIPGSDFSTWHTEKIPGFLTMGSVECPQMPGKAAAAWDCGNPAFSASGSKNWPTQKVVLKDGSIAAKLETRKVFGTIASGSLFTGRIVRNMSLKQLLGFTDKDGGQLIDFGVKFQGRPKAIRVKCAYNGLGDEFSICATLENRDSGNKDVIASALFVGPDVNTNKANCVTKVSEPDENGLSTIEIQFLYGQFPTGGDPLAEGCSQLAANTEVTHVNVCFSSSAHGNFFKGKKGAQLIVKDFEFVY